MRVAAGLLLLAGLLPVSAESVTLTPLRDATLIETIDGSLANGSGPGLFAGRNNQAEGSRRRALLAFDLAGAIPPEARIDAVRLTIDVSPSSAGAEPLALHRVLAAWTEGPASASGGGGAPTGPGDATWIHASFATTFWSAPGGDFAEEPSASIVAVEPGSLTWESTPALVADVRAWLEAPETNHGWIALGNESAPQTVKRFGSREESDPALRPRLTIDFTLPCVAGPAGAGYWHRQCLALGADGGGSEPGRAGMGRGPASLLEPAFVEAALPCAEALLATLGIEGGVCAALAPPAGGSCRQEARAAAAAALDLCSNRLRASCPVAGAGCGDAVNVEDWLAAGACGAAQACHPVDDREGAE